MTFFEVLPALGRINHIQGYGVSPEGLVRVAQRLMAEAARKGSTLDLRRL